VDLAGDAELAGSLAVFEDIRGFSADDYQVGSSRLLQGQGETLQKEVDPLVTFEIPYILKSDR
jgi:hypothetical protein